MIAFILGVACGAVPTYLAWQWQVGAMRTAFEYQREQRDWDPQY